MSLPTSDISALTEAFESLKPNDWMTLHQLSAGPDRSVIRRPITNPCSNIHSGSSLSLHPQSLKIWPLASPVPYEESQLTGSKLLKVKNLEQRSSEVATNPALLRQPDGVKVEIRGLSQQLKQKRPASSAGNTENIPPVSQEMTPVEQCSVAAVKKGRNVVVCIQSEKIAVSALLLPAIRRVSFCISQKSSSQSHDYMRNSASTIGGHRIRMLAKSANPYILLLAPTKDVAERVFEETIAITRRSSLNALLIRGGIDSRPQLQALQKGCDIIVATAGRLMDFLERGYISMSLVKVLILWEAGHMSNIGLQMKLRRVASFEGMPEETHQTLVYTRAFPRRLEAFCDSLMSEYTYVANDTTVSCLGITQTVEFVKDDADRRRLLLIACKKLPRSARALVFVATKRTAESITRFLVSQGITAGGLHGGRTQEEREASLIAYQEGRLPVLIATDVAHHVFEQLPSVDLVVSFDMPTNIDSYIRRTGRTLLSGLSLAFLSESSLPIIPALATVLKQCNQSAPRWFHEMAIQAIQETVDTTTPPSSISSQKSQP